MVRHPLRPTLLILLAAWLTIIAFAAHLLLSAYSVEKPFIGNAVW